MSGNFRMDDYVDVAQRIHDFYERFPEGSLQSGCAPFVIEIGGKPFIVYHALAYRTPDDPAPAHGWAWEPVPGPTQFTRDSELMNAETAAWGRAIVACGFSTKKIASAQEVRARQGSSQPAAEGAPGAAHPPAASAPTDAELELLFQLVESKGGDAAKTHMAAGMASSRGKLGEWYRQALTHWQAA